MTHFDYIISKKVLIVKSLQFFVLPHKFPSIINELFVPGENFDEGNSLILV